MGHTVGEEFLFVFVHNFIYFVCAGSSLLCGLVSICCGQASHRGGVSLQSRALGCVGFSGCGSLA